MSIVEHVRAALEKTKLMPNELLPNKEQIIARLESTLVEVGDARRRLEILRRVK